MPTQNTLECRLSLPEHYRWQEFIAFHSRDVSQSAERLDASAQQLLKALHWRGNPALLVLNWLPGEIRAQLHLSQPPLEEQAELLDLQAMVQRMLGLAYPPSALEQAYGKHKELGPLLARQRGLHVPAAPTPFEALSWAIMGQQISVAVAVALRRKLIALAGVPLSAGIEKAVPQAQAMRAYPEAVQVAALSVESLRAASFSQAKAATLLAVAQAVQSGNLPLDGWAQQSAQGLWNGVAVQQIEQQLLAIKGIGPWTLNYCLLRGYGWPDGSLHGDVAVRRAIGLLQQKATPDAQKPDAAKPDALQARIWLDQFQPWRALVAAHLWASLSDKSY